MAFQTPPVQNILQVHELIYGCYLYYIEVSTTYFPVCTDLCMEVIDSHSATPPPPFSHKEKSLLTQAQILGLALDVGATSVIIVQLHGNAL